MGTEPLSRSRFALFFPRSKHDPRSNLDETKARPEYYLGEEWTPKGEQIVEARKRQEERRAALGTRWRSVTSGSEFDAARAAIVCATNHVVQNDIDATRRNRLLRKFAFDDNAQIFIRNLRVSPDRHLIELRHPQLTIDSYPVGFRFIGLSAEAWHIRDEVGVYLDGSRDPIERLFASDFATTAKNPDLAESYLRFAFDHIKFGDNQFYLICDQKDFALASPDEKTSENGGLESPSLIGQFRIAVPDAAMIDK